MKKYIKMILIIISIVILFTIIDIISIYTNNKPIFAIKGSTPYMYSGLFYDTYNCPQYSVAQIKGKFTKYSCSENYH